ncbi:MAG TPA: super-infection exclusion protein B [Candidatus Angelobacter sp.]|nr:super-infection exclusion protein B [Candidatus Angelobacter sp.]
MNLVESTLNWLAKDLPWKSMVAIFTLSIVLLFSAAHFGIEKQVQQYRIGVVITFIFSGTWVAAHICQLFRPYGSQMWRRYRSRKHLKHLTSEEMRYCKWFLDNAGKSLPHNPGNGAIASLVQNGILWKPESGWQNNELFEFNIQPWALKYLRKHTNYIANADKDLAQ